MRGRVLMAAALAGLAALGDAGVARAQGTGGGPATDPTQNGGNTVVNQGAGSGTGTTDRARGTMMGTPTEDPTANGGNTVVNRGAGSGTGTSGAAGSGR